MALPSLTALPPPTPAITFLRMRLLAMLLLYGVHGESCFKHIFIESRRTCSVYSQKRVILQVANYAARVHWTTYSGLSVFSCAAMRTNATLNSRKCNDAFNYLYSSVSDSILTIDLLPLNRHIINYDASPYSVRKYQK